MYASSILASLFTQVICLEVTKLHVAGQGNIFLKQSEPLNIRNPLNKHKKLQNNTLSKMIFPFPALEQPRRLSSSLASHEKEQ